MLVVPAVLFLAMAEQYFEAELIFILSHEYSEKSMTLSDVTDLGIDWSSKFAAGAAAAAAGKLHLSSASRTTTAQSSYSVSWPNKHYI